MEHADISSEAPGGDGHADIRVRTAVQSALAALERARERRVRADIASLLTGTMLQPLEGEAWYDHRWRLLDGMLDVALRFAKSSHGQIHLMEIDGAEMHLRAQRGFDPPFLHQFDRVSLDSLPHRRTITQRAHVMIEDVALASDKFDVAYLRALDEAGLRAILCAPIGFPLPGASFGVLSVYFTQACCPTPDVCLSLDLLGREIADRLQWCRPNSEPES